MYDNRCGNGMAVLDFSRLCDDEWCDDDRIMGGDTVRMCGVFGEYDFLHNGRIVHARGGARGGVGVYADAVF